MSGSRKGGLRAAITNKKRYGEDYFKRIGHSGGRISRGGGITNHEQAVAMGRVGGVLSRRGLKLLRREPEGVIVAVDQIGKKFKFKYDPTKEKYQQI